MQAWNSSYLSEPCRDTWHDFDIETPYDLSITQRADIEITKEWLKLTQWQIKLKHAITAPNGSPLSLEYPIAIAEKMLNAASSIPQDAFEVHGVGICEKIYDVAVILTDLSSGNRDLNLQVSKQPIYQLSNLLIVLTQLREGKSAYVLKLINKIMSTLKGQ